MGSLQSPSSSSGHYRCDIKDPKSKSWFRTNDNTTPTQIEEEDVSKQGYIVLLTKKDWKQRSFRSCEVNHIKGMNLQRLSQWIQMYTFPKAQPVYWWGCGRCVLYYIMNSMKVKTPTTSKNIDQAFEHKGWQSCIHFQRLSQCTGGAAESVYSTILWILWKWRHQQYQWILINLLNTQNNSHVSPKARRHVMAWTLIHELILDQVLGHPKSNVCISKGSASVLGLRKVCTLLYYEYYESEDTNNILIKL